MPTYAFDPQAATNGTGSEGSPFNVLPANFSSGGFVDGDVFLQKRGSIYAPTWAGTDATLHTVNRRITFGAYGDGPKPIIQPTYTGTGSGRLFRVFTSGCVFQDIVFSDGVFTDPLYVNGSIADFTAQRCEFYNIGGDVDQNGINCGAAAPLTGTIRVLHCVFDTIANDAMTLNCSGAIEVGFNRVVRPSAFAANGDCISISGDCADLWIHDNHLTHDENDNKHVIIVDFTTGVGFARVEDNILIGANKPGIYMSLPAAIRRNFISTGRSGVFVNSANIDLRHNVILQRAGEALTGAVWCGLGGFTGLKVINNTIARNTSFAELSEAAIRNNFSDASCEYRNNLIQGFNVGIRRGALAVEGNNAYWQVGANPVIDASAAPVAANSPTLTDPRLSADYMPKTGSPLLTAGADLGYLRDMRGHQAKRYIGAYAAAAIRDR